MVREAGGMLDAGRAPAPDLVTPRATPIAPTAAWSWDDERLAQRLHPLYGQALERAPSGRLVSRGLPFELPAAGAPGRWLVVEQPIEVDLGGVPASHLVLLAFCDASHDESGARPIGTPVGWVLPVGEPLAVARVETTDGGRVTMTLRRRFEVNEGIVGWGSVAFLAMPHKVERSVPWQGPHPRLPRGRFAPAGHTGALGVLPGSWSTGQSGVEDHIPSATDDLMLWLHALDVSAGGQAGRLRSIRLEPVGGSLAGRLVVIAAMTAFEGTASPLRWAARRSLRLSPSTALDVRVDLGIVARRRPLPASAGPTTGITGWGRGAATPATTTGTADEEAADEEVEVTAAEDAVLAVGEWRIPLRSALATDVPAPDAAPVSIRPLPVADRRVTLTVEDGSGRPSPARIRVTAPDGRYLPPLGHRDEVNPGLNEDLGADLVIGGLEYAYGDGAFTLDLPAEGARVEVVSGQQRAPVVAEIGVADIERGALRLTLPPPLAPADGTWLAADTHVHYLAPSTAFLQAAAEGIDVVQLLATQWGDHHTNVTDIGGDIVDADGRRAVFVGSENRQNMLGHLVLTGTSRPVLPFASAGPPEGRIGGPATVLLADWLQRCREGGGLAIGAHFPLPMAEIAADIAMGLVDALEFETFDPTLESPPVREWYRYLGAGYRLPIVGGTDKMTASVALGQIRTWAQLEPGKELTFDTWATAVRAGRTFVSSGPLLDLRVDGRGPGDTIRAAPGATVEVELVARAAQAVVSDVELVVDGRVVGAESSPTPSTLVALRERIVLDRSGWLAGRSRSPYIVGGAVASAMNAHTSPVYIECDGAPRRPPDLGMPLALIHGTRAWLEQLAPVRGPADAARFARFLDEAERRLRAQAGDGDASPPA